MKITSLSNPIQDDYTNNNITTRNTQHMNVISPTYQNDISSINENKVVTETIKFDDYAKLKSLENELNTIFPKKEGTDIQIYDVSVLSEKLDLPLEGSKVVGYYSYSGHYTYKCFFDNGDTCSIEMLSSENERNQKFSIDKNYIADEELTKPLDVTTFKNTVLKAIKMNYEAIKQLESFKKNDYTQFGTSIVYDGITKSADLEELARGLKLNLSTSYLNRNHDGSDLNVAESKYLNEMLGYLDESFSHTLDEIY